MGVSVPRLRLGFRGGAFRLARACGLGAALLLSSLVAIAQDAAPVTEADIVGLTRADVVRSLGKPQSTARRGDREILIYANGARVELLGDEVVSFQGGPTSIIIDEDGIRYIPGADGKVRRADGQAIVRGNSRDQAALAEETAAEAAAADGTREPLAEAAQAAVATAEAAPATGEAEDTGLREFSTVANLDEKIPGTKTTVESYLETGQIVPEDEEKPPAWVNVTGEIVGLVLRFGFVVLILGMAIRWVGLPFYWPDLLKVSALYVAVRESIYGLGAFGGLWEFIRLFKIADGVSYLALMFFLYKFEVVREGITALKIATATKLVTYFLMMIIMLALTFILMAFH